jgi:hypothetical protein
MFKRIFATCFLFTATFASATPADTAGNIAKATLFSQFATTIEFAVNTIDFSYTSVEELASGGYHVEAAALLEWGVICRGVVEVGPDMQVVSVDKVFGGWCADIR